MFAIDDREFSHMMHNWEPESPHHQDRLFSVLYPHMERLSFAAKQAGPSITLSGTEVAHEVFLRLSEQRENRWQSRAHFASIVSRLARRVIVDYQRYRCRDKRGGGRAAVELDSVNPKAPENFPHWLAFDQALKKLRAVDETAAQTMELRQILGMDVSETALALGCSERTVKRKYQFARLWLQRLLQD